MEKVDNLKKLQTQMTELLDKATDKEQVAALTVMNETVKAVVDETNDLRTGYQDLFKEYREAVKHASFTPKGTEKVDPREEKKEITFEEFLDNYMKEKKEKKEKENAN